MAIDESSLIVLSTNIIALGDPTEPQGDEGLIDLLTGSYVNDATVELEVLLHLATNTTVTGFTPPLAMAYLPGSNGVYRAELSASIADNIIVRNAYDVSIRATAIGGTVKVFSKRLWAERG